MSDFEPIAASLRRAIANFYEHRGQSLETREVLMTLETNSAYIERRGAPLLEMLAQHAGVESIDGLEVVDVGCGFGALSLYFAAQGAMVTGIDPNRARLRVTRRVVDEHGLTVRLMQGRMEELDLPDASFDVAVQNNSFCYVIDREDRSRALRETLRVLRPGGALVARNPNRWSPVDQFTGMPLIHLLPPRTAVRCAAALRQERSLCRLASPPAARRELRRAGFVDVVQPGFGSRSRKPNVLKVVARYQHFTARRPADAATPRAA